MPRDSSGAYTLPSGNPVVDGTVIESVWANDTMSDLAVQMNNVFTRDGLLGPIAPVLFVNGTVPLPGIAFRESPSSGIMRLPPNTLQLVIGGVVRQAWTPTGTTMAGTAAVGGTLTVGGNTSITGDLTVTGSFSFGGLTPFGIAPGTALLPGLFFTGDPNTGMWSPGADTIGFTAGGVNRLTLDVNGTLAINGITNPSSPGLAIGPVAAGGFGIDIRGRTGDQLSVIRLLSNDYSTQYFTIQANNANAVIGSTQAIPLDIFTNALSRINISTSGVVTIAQQLVVNGAYAQANNFYVGQVSTAAGTVGVAGGLGAAAVYWGNTSAGVGAMDLYAFGAKQAEISPLAGATNYWSIYGATGGGRVVAEARGASGDIGQWFISKGTGDILFSANGGNVVQMLGTPVGSTWFQFSGNSGVAPNYPILGSNAAKISVGIAARFLGATTLAGDLATTYVQVGQNTIGFVNPAPTANNKGAEILWSTGTGFQARFINDAYNDARTIWAAFGGVAAGVTDINMYTGANDLTLRLTNGSGGGNQGRLGIGPAAPLAQLQVYGPGTADAAGAVFDPVLTPTQGGAVVFLADTGVVAGNGGAVVFGAFAASPSGRHFASIKGYITDASNNTAGELRFNTKNSSTDTGSTQALRITADKNLYDNRNLPLARDPGTTAGSTNPIGSMVIGLIGSGININALTTINAATNNITIQGTSSGTNLTINSGTWRNCGATTTNSLAALWLRVA